MVISSHLCCLGCNQHVLPQELARVLTPTGRAIWFSLPAETRARMESRVLYMCNYVRLIHLDILYDNTWSIYIYIII